LKNIPKSPLPLHQGKFSKLARIVARASTSVARWLSWKPAKLYHKKMLDPAKKHFTNFS